MTPVEKQLFMKKLLPFIIILFSNITIAQTTAIPDANFEQALINLGLDSVPINGSIPSANIDTVLSLNLYNKNISDLSGIEDFTALEQLRCWNNLLTNLNLTQNTGLIYLECWGNGLTSLDVSQNTSLVRLFCQNNSLTNLDVTLNTALLAIQCQNNQLTSLDVTNNLALYYLHCFNNQITSLDVTQNTSLIWLDCSVNQITSLILTQNTSLKELKCNNNQLSCLNIKNGNNSNISYFYAHDNPNLTCIEVDNVAWSVTNWNYIDPQSSYGTWCQNSCSVGVNENNFTELSIYPNPTTGNTTIDLGETFLNVNATLTDNLGKIILTKEFISTNVINIHIDAPSGIYFLQLRTCEGKSKTFKILKK